MLQSLLPPLLLHATRTHARTQSQKHEGWSIRNVPSSRSLRCVYQWPTTCSSEPEVESGPLTTFCELPPHSPLDDKLPGSLSSFDFANRYHHSIIVIMHSFAWISSALVALTNAWPAAISSWLFADSACTCRPQLE